MRIRLITSCRRARRALSPLVLAGAALLSGQAVAQSDAATTGPQSPLVAPAADTGAAAAETAARDSGDAQAQDAADVARLQAMLRRHYAEMEALASAPSAEDIAKREAAQREAELLEQIPFSADKIQLSGDEGSTALATITQRLADPTIPESRHSIAPICTIKTRLFDTLVASENRSLQPVGKNHYVARVKLQPGDTTLSILSDQWEVRLPQDASPRDFLITLYRPKDGTPELHIVAVDDLLAVDNPHIPAWLPDDLNLKKTAG